MALDGLIILRLTHLHFRKKVHRREMTDALTNTTSDVQRQNLPRYRRFWIVCVVGFLILLAMIPIGLQQYGNWRAQRSKDFARSCRANRQSMDWEKLASISDQWRAWDKKSAEAILFRAEAAQGLRDFRLAADILNEVPHKHPKRLGALIERSSLLFGPANRPLEGVKTCQQVLEIEPRAFAAHQRLIFFYALTLQQDELLRQIYKAIELGSEPIDAYVYLVLADVLSFQNGFEVTNRWLADDISQEMFLVSRTIHAWKDLSLVQPTDQETKEKMELAEKLLREYLDRFRTNVSLLAFFLNLAVTNGEVAEAERLLSYFPDNATADSRYWRFKGWIHAAKDEVDEAEAAYKESLNVYPLSWTVRHELADVLRRQKNFQQVSKMQELALLGKDLRRELLEMPDARSVTKATLTRIRDYSQLCGDDFVAGALTRRLQTFSEKNKTLN